MKKLLILLLSIILLFGCNTDPPSISNKESEQVQHPVEETIISLGKPFEEQYSSQIAKNPWDMIIFENKLFIGSGDYDQNIGGCKIACYDLSSNTLRINTVPDEEINSFVVLNNRLTAPGIDPIDDWSLGNYYIYNAPNWETVRNIPNGIHNFTMIEHNSMIFTGLGTTEGKFPAMASQDGGNTFTQVHFYKDELLCAVTDSKSDRIYDFFILNDHLFAVKTANDCQIFLYNEEYFEYYDSWLYKAPFAEADYLHDIKKRGGFLASATYENTFYFTTGHLFKTRDGNNVEYISLNNVQYVIDLYFDNEVLYVLGISQCKDGSFLSSVYSIKNNESKFLFDIQRSTFPISLAVSGSDFYLGFGYTVYDPELSGAIIKYTYKAD